MLYPKEDKENKILLYAVSCTVFQNKIFIMNCLRSYIYGDFSTSVSDAVSAYWQ